MAKLLSCGELYETIQRKSENVKEILWVCSPNVGTDAHKVFSQELFRNPPSDIRFVFQVNDLAAKRGELDPYEIQYLMEHLKGGSIKSLDNFTSRIYIFDNSALITSASLTKNAFESNIEFGVLVEGTEAEEAKNFFHQNLWSTAKTIGDLKKLKRIWNIAQQAAKKDRLKRVKSHTIIKDWTNEQVNTWYIGVYNRISAKAERKMKKETKWQKELSIVGDVGYNCFRQLKLGELAYIANLNKTRGKIEIEFARIFDKERVETDQGDFHFAYETENTHLIEREQFYEMLKNANISSRTSETLLSSDQLKQIVNSLSSIKHKRKSKTKANKKT